MIRGLGSPGLGSPIGRMYAGGCALLVLTMACSDPADQNVQSWFELAGHGSFRGDVGPRARVAFDAVAADMDRDGDPDLLINWHHTGPLELFENEAGVLVQQTPAESGLADSGAAPDLFADTAEIDARIRAAGAAGLFVWHERHPYGRWNFLWNAPEADRLGYTLELEASRGFGTVDGLPPGALQRPGPRQLVVVGEVGAPTQRFSVETPARTGRLALRLRALDGGPGAPLFVGDSLTPIAGGSAELWRPDPHGVAWADVTGSREPDLYVTRGGLAGFLRPPLVGKRDRLFVHRGGERPIYRLEPPSALPRDHRRSRQVEWVDTEGNGALALSVTARRSPNGLLTPDGETGALRDTAEARGLALRGAEVASWGDLDEDGLPDLFTLLPDGIDVWRNPGQGQAFLRIPGESLGLQLPEQPPGKRTLFDKASLRHADFDNDGRLDLWLLGYGPERANRLFLRRAEGFEDATERVGLADVQGNHAVVLLDADNDSFLDAVSFGAEQAWLWRNRGGERFERTPLNAALVPEPIYAATAADFDGDGLVDLVLVGHGRHLLRNRAGARNTSLEVRLEQPRSEPVGALVRAYYADGRTALQRYGSTANSGLSQALQPLHFGIPAGLRIDRIGVQWPGRTSEVSYPVGDASRAIRLERSDGP